MSWFSRKKAPPQNVAQMAAQSPVTRFNPNWAFTYERKRLPSPGAQNYAFENLGLVEFTPIGPAEHNRLQWQVTAGQPAYAGLAVWQQGLGGVVQGTIYGYPLTVSQPPTDEQIYV